MSTVITPKYPNFLHGGDYNPEQWREYPGIFEKDIELMKKAHCNCMSVGIFSWASLEPEEGVFTFDWLQKVIDTLYENGIYTVLATPSGGKPNWLVQKYPEVAQVNTHGMREHNRFRHNFCKSSPLFREKIKIIDEKLAERFANHPGVVMWHISNEFSGSGCYCENCRQAFIEWLKQRYVTLEKLNHEWWSTVWSHNYTDWDQIYPPSELGDTTSTAICLDWRRFNTYLTVDYMKTEIDAVKKYNPDIPVTTNMMPLFFDLDYFKFKDSIDLSALDCYPSWHGPTDDISVASSTALCYDVARSLKPDRPFVLMESTPSTMNWKPASKLKRPGVHKLSSLQAIAHGSNTVQYFQFRTCRGGPEKFHGAIVDHYGNDKSRVFNEVADLGKTIKKIGEVYNSVVKNDVSILFDWENRWALDHTDGPRNCGMKYEQTIEKHHRYFWKNSIGTDIVDEDCEIDHYKLLVAPLMYMLRPKFAEKLRSFVENGGILILSYFSGIVNESDLCYLNGFPGLISDMAGLNIMETDALYDGQTVSVEFNGKAYTAKEICDIINTDTAETLGTYTSEFYAGTPAVTVNNYGKGKVYFIAARMEEDFIDEFYSCVLSNTDIKSVVSGELPYGVVATRRVGENSEYIFIQNFNTSSAVISLEKAYTDILSGETVTGEIKMPEYGILILKAAINR